MAMYEVVLRYSSPSGAMLNVLHYNITGTAPLDFQSLTDTIGVIFTTQLAPSVCGTISYLGTTIREDTPGSVSADFDDVNGPRPGAAPTSHYAGPLAMLVRKRSGNLVRPAQGWAFQGGLTSESLGSDGKWTTPIADDVRDFWEDLLEVNFDGSGNAEMQIKATNPTAPNTVAYNPATLIAISRIPTTMKSRKEGTGI